MASHTGLGKLVWRNIWCRYNKINDKKYGVYCGCNYALFFNMDWSAIEASGGGPYLRTEDITEETTAVRPEMTSALSYVAQMEDASRNLTLLDWEELTDEITNLEPHQNAYPSEKNWEEKI